MTPRHEAIMAYLKDGWTIVEKGPRFPYGAQEFFDCVILSKKGKHDIVVFFSDGMMIGGALRSLTKL